MAAAKDRCVEAKGSGADPSGVEAKLDVVIRLLALEVAPDSLTLADRAVRLQRVGLAPKEIAQVCGTTPNAVSVALSGAKKSKSKKKAK